MSYHKHFALNCLRRSIRNLLFLLVLFIPMMLKAAVPTGSAVEDSLTTPTPDTTAASKKHPWLAGLEIAGLNGVLLGVDRIIYSDRDWTHVTLKSIGENLTHSYWCWDQDDLGVNAFRHPVHGTIFYLIARANNMNIWESSLYTLGGSWMWEMFCEAEKPSINDMVYTTVGGITIGETLWRSGKSIIGMLKKDHQGRQSFPFTTSLTAGYRNFEGYNTKAVHTAFLTWEATYGDMFDASKRGMFDNFDISGTLVLGNGQRYVSEARIDHQIVSKPVVDELTKKVVMGLYNHFDFIFASPLETLKKHVPESYSYSEVGAIGPGIAYRLGEHTCWEQHLYVNGIMMGAVPEYNYHKESRGYSFGSGYGARLYSKLSVGSWLRMGVRAQFSHLFTWDGFYEDDHSKSKSPDMIQGEQGNALTAIVAPTIEVQPFKHLALQCSGRFMHTHLNYTYHPHTSTHAWEMQIGIKYRIHN